VKSAWYVKKKWGSHIGGFRNVVRGSKVQGSGFKGWGAGFKKVQSSKFRGMRIEQFVEIEAWQLARETIYPEPTTQNAEP
jgi:hypothetical protein